MSMAFIMEARTLRAAVFFEMPMTPTLDPAAINNTVAKRWLQDNLCLLQDMETSQSPSFASIPSVESSNSGGNKHTNDSKGNKKLKYETWSYDRSNSC